MATSKTFPTVYRIVGLSQQVWGYKPPNRPPMCDFCPYWHQIRCFWTLAHKNFRACSPSLALSKNVKFGGGGLPNFGEIWTKVQNLTPNISSPKGFGGPILALCDRGTWALLKFLNWGPSHFPPIFGEFFSKIWGFSTLTPGFSLQTTTIFF